MADIDTLRQALRDNWDSPYRTVDVDLIVTRGRSLRRRRRLMAGAAAACLVAAAAGTVVGITHQASPAPVPAQHRGSTVTHHPTPPPYPTPSSGVPGSPTPTPS
jgi:hypothetical protein